MIEPTIPCLVELMTCSNEWDDMASAAALETIVEKEPQLVKPAIPKLLRLLGDTNERVRLCALEEYVRMYALGVMSDLGEAEVLAPLTNLIQDTSEVLVVSKESVEKDVNPAFIRVTVGQVAREAVEKIKTNRQSRQIALDRGLKAAILSLDLGPLGN